MGLTFEQWAGLKPFLPYCQLQLNALLVPGPLVKKISPRMTFRSSRWKMPETSSALACKPYPEPRERGIAVTKIGAMIGGASPDCYCGTTRIRRSVSPAKSATMLVPLFHRRSANPDPILGRAHSLDTPGQAAGSSLKVAGEGRGVLDVKRRRCGLPAYLPTRRPLIYRSGMSFTYSSLRLLDAATRHESFTDAGKEIGITHSAMSSGIRRIETDLRVTLFRRQTHKTYPTDAALALAAAYREADGIIRAAIARIQPDADTFRPRIKVDQDLWDLWLEDAWNTLFADGVVPGLYPDVTRASGMFSSGDLHLSFENEAVKGYARRIFATLRLVIVGDAENAAALASPTTCKIFAPKSTPWRAWLADGNGRDRIGQVTELVYHRDCLDRAMEGDGFAITYRLFARDLVESGRLSHFPEIGAQSVRRPLYLYRRKDSAHAGTVSVALSHAVGRAIVIAQEEWW